jgi:hypothetical protein
MKKIFLIGFLIVFFFSCNKTERKNDSISASKSERKNDSDTVYVSGKSIVFFTISQPEYDSLSKHSASEIDEALSDFNHYAQSISDTIKKSGYKSTMTASRYIQVKLNNGTRKTFDRHKDKENITGYILSDGRKEPRIEYGVETDMDFLIKFDKFNKDK